MKRFYKLTPTVTRISVGLGFEAGICYVSNPTGSPILLRVGAPEIPSSDSADYTIPALGEKTLSVIGHEFGITFADATLLQTFPGGNVASVATVQFQTPDEPLPQFGAASFQSLSLSEIKPNTAFSGLTTVGPLDLGPWGGAMVYVNPSSGSGQGVVQVNVSSTGLSWNPLGTYAFWPNVPAVITVPRVIRYLQIILNPTAIVGEPAIAGSYSIRATITELQNLVYNPGSQAITKTFNLAASGAQQYQFVTVGLPAVSLAAIATVGTGASAAATLLVEASADLINWRRVTYRTQRMSQGVTLYRALGNLDLFIRVTVFEVGAVSALVGSLYLSIPPAADLGYILNTIQQSLGDSDAPSNTNQDIYHELDNVRTGVNSVHTDLSGTIHNDLITINSHDSAIDANIAAFIGYLAQLPTIHTDLSNTIHTDLATTLHTDLAGINSHESAIDSNIAAFIGHLAQLPTIHTDLSTTLHGDLATTIHTDLATTLHNDLVNLKTDLDGLFAGYGGSVLLYNNTTAVAAGTWTNTGTQVAVGARVVGAHASVALSAAAGGSFLGIAIGTNGAVGPSILGYYASTGNAALTIANGPALKFDSLRAGGFGPAVALSNYIWVFSSNAGTIGWNVTAAP